MGNPAPVIPAATVVLLRDGHEGLEVLLLRRNPELAAFPGAWVFPGGRVDAGDMDGAGDEIADAARAALRETQEETGLQPTADGLDAISYWEPGPKAPRRFGTWFFLAEAPEGEVEIDRGEIHDHSWLSPAAALARQRRGKMLLIPPTFVTLHHLQMHETVAAARAAFAGRPPHKFLTNFLQGPTGFVSLWPEDVAYENEELGVPGPRHRLVEEPSGWRYISDF